MKLCFGYVSFSLKYHDCFLVGCSHYRSYASHFGHYCLSSVADFRPYEDVLFSLRDRVFSFVESEYRTSVGSVESRSPPVGSGLIKTAEQISNRQLPWFIILCHVFEKCLLKTSRMKYAEHSVSPSVLSLAYCDSSIRSTCCLLEHFSCSLFRRCKH